MILSIRSRLGEIKKAQEFGQTTPGPPAMERQECDRYFHLGREVQFLPYYRFGCSSLLNAKRKSGYVTRPTVQRGCAPRLEIES